MNMVSNKSIKQETMMSSCPIHNQILLKCGACKKDVCSLCGCKYCDQGDNKWYNNLKLTNKGYFISTMACTVFSVIAHYFIYKQEKNNYCYMI